MASMASAVPLLIPAEGPETMIPGLDDAKTTEMRARLDDRIGVAAVTYLLFGVKLGPALALSSLSSPSGSVGDGCAANILRPPGPK
jgi:hypothetical protein